MPKISKTNFNGGVVDERINYRPDLAVYANSCRQVDNGKVVALGGIRRGRGFNSLVSDLALVPGATKFYTKFFESNIADEAHIVIFNHGTFGANKWQLEVYKILKTGARSSVGLNGSILEYSISEGVYGVWTNPQVRQVGYDLYITDPNNPPLKMKLRSDGEFDLETIPFVGGPFQDYPTAGSAGDKIQTPFTIVPPEYYIYSATQALVTDDHVFDVAMIGDEIIMYQDNTVTSHESTADIGVTSITITSEALSIQGPFDVSVEWEVGSATSVRLEVSTDKGVGWSTVFDDIGSPIGSEEVITSTTRLNSVSEFALYRVVLVIGATATTIPNHISIINLSETNRLVGTIATFVDTKNATADFGDYPIVNDVDFSPRFSIDGVEKGITNSIKIDHASDEEFYIGEATVTATEDIFTKYSIGRKIRMKQDASTKVVSIQTKYIGVYYSDRIYAYGIGVLELKTSGYFHGTVSVQKSYDDGEGWEDIYSHSSRATAVSSIDNVVKVLDATEHNVIYRVRMEKTGWSYYKDPDTIAELSNKGAAVDVLGTVIDYINARTATIELESYAVNNGEYYSRWSWGEFHYQSFPRAIEVHEDRLYLAGTKDSPQKIWSSKIGDFFDFTPSTDDDGTLSVQLATDILTDILWLKSNKRSLLIGTGSEVWRMAQTDAGKSLSATNFRLENLDNSGCSEIEPILIGSRLIFVGRNKNKIYELIYDENGNQIVNHISMKADSIFDAEINSITSCKERDDIIYIGMDDGRVIILVSNAIQQVNGYSQLTNLTDVSNVLKIRLNKVDHLSYLNHTDNKIYVDTDRDWENQSQLKTDAISGIEYLDSSRYIDGDSFELAPFDGFSLQSEGDYIVPTIKIASIIDYVKTDGTGKVFIYGNELSTLLFNNGTLEFTTIDDGSDEELTSILAGQHFNADNAVVEDSHLKVETEIILPSRLNETIVFSGIVTRLISGEMVVPEGKIVVCDGVDYGGGTVQLPARLSQAVGIHRDLVVETLDFTSPELGINSNVQLSNIAIAVVDSTGGKISFVSGGVQGTEEIIVNNDAEPELTTTTGVRQMSKGSSASAGSSAIKLTKGVACRITQDRAEPFEIVGITTDINARS